MATGRYVVSTGSPHQARVREWRLLAGLAQSPPGREGL